MLNDKEFRMIRVSLNNMQTQMFSPTSPAGSPMIPMISREGVIALLEEFKGNSDLPENVLTTDNFQDQFRKALSSDCIESVTVKRP